MTWADGATLDRRTFLRRSGKVAAAAALATQPGWLMACGSSDKGASADDWRKLEKSLRGRLLMAGDPGYSRSGLPYNTVYQAVRPHGLAMCESAEDARTALMWAKETGEEFTVMSGGHSYAGFSTCKRLVINLSRLNKMTFDPSDGRLVAGAGARNAQLYSDLPKYHVSLPHGRCAAVALGGYVLGGGFGFTSRSHGMFCDHLLSTEILTADGDILTCDARQNKDLYWASKGGAGGSFGINTSYTFRTNEAPERITVFQLKWPWEPAAEVLQTAQKLMRDAPRNMGFRIELGSVGLESKTNYVHVLGEYDGPVGQARELLAELLATGKPSEVVLKELPHAEAITFLTHTIASDEFVTKSCFAAEPFPEAGVAAFVGAVDEVPGSSNPNGTGITIYCLGGAVNDVAPDATAYVHRDARFLMACESRWNTTDPAGAIEATKKWPQSAWDALQPYVLKSSYQNFPDRTLKTWQSAYFGDNLDRLTRIKSKHDPDDVFHYSQSVPLHT